MQKQTYENVNPDNLDKTEMEYLMQFPFRYSEYFEFFSENLLSDLILSHSCI